MLKGGYTSFISALMDRASPYMAAGTWAEQRMQSQYVDRVELATDQVLAPIAHSHLDHRDREER
jgi:hypothetical protein